MRRLLFYTVNKLYDIEISDSTLSRIIDKILPIVKEWPAAAREYVKERGVQVIQKEEKLEMRTIYEKYRVCIRYFYTLFIQRQ